MSPSVEARLLNATLGAFAQAIRPQRPITVSQWADAHRVVTRPSPRPGPWETDFVPYVREIQDNLSPSSPVNITALMKAAQGAGTEAGLNAIGCWMDRYPDDIILSLPTSKVAKKFVYTRLDKMFEACEPLRRLVERGSRKSGNSALLKTYGAGRDNLIVVGANSGNELRSSPARRAVMDEVDGCEADLDNEGSPDELLLQRLAAYRDFKLYLLSTPTLVDTSLIAKWYARGDQRLYHVPCPFCRHEQPLVFGEDRVREGRPGGLRWPKGDPEKVAYQCEHCGDVFEEWRKVGILKRGVWVPQKPERSKLGDMLIRTYQLSALYYPYPWPGNSWVNLAANWEEGHKDPVKRKSFINLKLGLPYSDPTEAKADADTLLARRESYGPEVPGGVAILTFGADVQGNRIEAELVGWGRDEESWSIDYRVFPGDTSKLVNGGRSPWEQLDQWIRGDWLSEMGMPLAVAGGCVDAGYNSQTVRQWCGERAGRRIWAIIGRPGQVLPVWPARAARKAGRAARYPASVVVGVDAAKDVFFSRLRIADFGPGFVHIPTARDRDWCEMVTSEVCVPDYSSPVPKRVWKKKVSGARNEALDCRNYAYAALVALQLTSALRLNQEHDALVRLAEQRRQDLLTHGAPQPRPVRPSGPQVIARF